MSDLDIDARPIDEIPFAQDHPESMRAVVQTRVRETLKSAGAKTAQDVIMLGCTGLVQALTQRMDVGMARLAALDVRCHMAGAGFGLPCYIAPNRYCHVHAGIGGLQTGQMARHIEAAELCSRELTKEERAQVDTVHALMDKEAARDARTVEHDDPAETTDVERAVTALGNTFVCPEHDTMVWGCRYCLAAAIIHGPFQPEMYVELKEGMDVWNDSIDKLEVSLRHPKAQAVSVFVCVKKWQRELVEVK